MTEGLAMLRGAERVHAVAAAAAVVITAAVRGADSFVASVAVAVLLGAANLRVLAWTTARVLAARGRLRTMWATTYVLKLGVLAAICYVLIVRAGIDPVGFAAGVTLTPMALLLAAWWHAGHPVAHDVAQAREHRR